MSNFDKKKAERIRQNEQKAPQGAPKNPDKKIKTNLYFHPKANIKAEDKFVYQFYHNELDPLPENTLSIATIDGEKNARGIKLKTIIRHTQLETIELQRLTVAVLDSEHRLLAEKAFDLSKLGALPPYTARPHVLTFEKSLFKQFASLSPDGLIVQFKRPHQLDLDKAWTEALSDDQVDHLKHIVQQARSLKPGEINLLGLEAKEIEPKKILVSFLLRNGSQKDLNFQKVPLRLRDKDKQVIAEAGFNFDDFNVKSNTSQPKSVLFDENNLKQDSFDLEGFSIEVIQS